MSLRKGHGAGAGQPRIEILPADELPDPVAAPAPRDSAPLTFRPNGQIGDKETARALGAKGGKANALRVRLVTSLGLAKLADTAALKSYWAAADEFTAHHLKELAAVAGGVVTSGPSSMVVSAALQLAASRYLFDRGAENGDPALLKSASALANDSRQNILGAYELAVRQAKAGADMSAPYGADAEAMALVKRAVAAAKAKRDQEDT